MGWKAAADHDPTTPRMPSRSADGLLTLLARGAMPSPRPNLSSRNGEPTARVHSNCIHAFVRFLVWLMHNHLVTTVSPLRDPLSGRFPFRTSCVN
jgi:hypothetical protein